MLIKFKNKDNHQTDAEALALELRDSNRRTEFFLLSIRALMQFTKEFALDLKEINSDGFKEDISGLSELFATESKLKKIQSRFEKGKKRIEAFIRLKKNIFLTEKTNLKISLIS
jgi:hypothetical protein